nr:MarR family transcriptional regulator [Actinomycetales bacterium]
MAGNNPSWEASQTLLALHHFIRSADELTAELARRAGLSRSELLALELLLDGPLAPADLSRELGVTSAAVSGVVDRLSARGHAERVRHTEDRRRVTVLITDSGRSEVLQTMAGMFEDLRVLDAAFTTREQAVVARYLRAAADAVHSFSGEDRARSA